MAEKVIPIERPTCGVNGFFPPKAGQKYGAMCGQIGAGGTKLCHYEGKCEHQRATQAAKQPSSQAAKQPSREREMKLIHLNTGGRHFKLTIGAKPFYFEDHPHLGPMMTDRHGEPTHKQLDENHLFFEHYNAWREQGKRFERMGAVNYCRYKTRIQRLRATQAAKQGEVRP